MLVMVKEYVHIVESATRNIESLCVFKHKRHELECVARF
jgi:hypothetical protein